jgi:hypothetical protein
MLYLIPLPLQKLLVAFQDQCVHVRARRHVATLYKYILDQLRAEKLWFFRSMFGTAAYAAE